MSWCPGKKRRYATQDIAANALRTLAERRENGTIEDYCWADRAYFCEVHNGWHLTKTPLNREPVDSDVLPGEY